ncbi:aminotransferase class I/II-fold pyridoxal phosphate-dependent enzyme [bacterium]|nr:aminotransferase class I/II-fold pyridoxal phosphate-dependent enzyme [bacterium]
MSKVENFTEIKKKFLKLKQHSGTHSPSIKTVLDEIKEIKIKVDACFLSNPYATNLFLENLESDFPKYSDLRECLEFYPPQNNDIANKISKIINISSKNIFVGNGAIEIISAAIKKFSGSKILLPIPTFSSYYEYANKDQEIIFHNLKEKDNYELNVNKLKKHITDCSADSLVLINPNNPNGDYIKYELILEILEHCKHLKCVMLDESFVHFAYEDDRLDLLNYYNLIEKYSNLVIIKSMSKDFGIAGVRAGYGIMSEKRVSELLKSDFLWNSSGLASYFFDLYAKEDFRLRYDIVRKKYIMNTLMFKDELNQIKDLKVYPSKANFFLVKIKNDKDGDFGLRMLLNHGVYIRNCSDKIGLEGDGYYRIASRTFEENISTLNAIKIEIKKLS